MRKRHDCSRKLAACPFRSRSRCALFCARASRRAPCRALRRGRLRGRRRESLRALARSSLPRRPADWRAWIVPPEESRQEAGGAPALPPLAAHLPPGGGPARWPNFRVGNEAIPASPDPLRMYLENQARVREELKRRDLAAVLIYDPLNLRYVSGVRNMSIWTFHSPARYGFLPAEGPFVLFDFHGSAHLSDDAATVGEVRPARSWYYFTAGNRVDDRAREWADEIFMLLKACGGGAARRLAVDRLDPPGTAALADLGVELEQGQAVLEYCRARKSPDETRCHAPRDRGLRGFRRRPAVVAPPRGERESGLGADERVQPRQRRRVERDAPLRLGPAHQPVVPRVQPAPSGSGRCRFAGYRPRRAIRDVHRHVAQLRDPRSPALGGGPRLPRASPRPDPP